VTVRSNARLAALSGSALLAVAFGGAASAQAFPERPVQIVVPFGPGGTTDIMARLLAEEFGRQLGGAAVVVNTAGAGGSIAMGNVARAKADGHTLAMTTIGPLTIQPARRDNTGYTPASFDYLCGTYDVPMLTMVAAASPHKDYRALVAWAKAHPGKLNYGSSGLGTMPHVSALQQWQHHGIEVLHVPYKSTGDMVVPLKNGELAMFNETPPVAVQHQLRALVALTDARVPGFEDVPSAKELGLPVRGSVWGGLVAPKGLPADVRAKLERACAAATATTLYKARAQAANSPLVYRDSAAFARFAQAEFEKFKALVAANGLQER
jgi:tripartite-type tricarboxylate transporter receptor subunit TctC